MRKKVVFISLPMTGKTEMEIDHDFYKAKKAYLNLMGQSIEEVAFVNNYRLSQNALESERVDAELRGRIFIEPYHLPIWNLGIALTNLAYSDVAFFYGDWENSSGCRIEHAVCEDYDMLIHEYREDEKETEK